MECVVVISRSWAERWLLVLIAIVAGCWTTYDKRGRGVVHFLVISCYRQARLAAVKEGAVWKSLLTSSRRMIFTNGLQVGGFRDRSSRYVKFFGEGSCGCSRLCNMKMLLLEGMTSCWLSNCCVLLETWRWWVHIKVLRHCACCHGCSSWNPTSWILKMGRGLSGVYGASCMVWDGKVGMRLLGLCNWCG